MTIFDAMNSQQRMIRKFDVATETLETMNYAWLWSFFLESRVCCEETSYSRHAMNH